jgi:hypothetical protein
MERYLKIWLLPKDTIEKRSKETACHNQYWADRDISLQRLEM